MGDQAPNAAQVDFQKALRELAAVRRGEDLLYASASTPHRPPPSHRRRRPLYSQVSGCIELACLITRRVRRGDTVPTYVSESPAPVGSRKTWLAIQAALEFCEEHFREGVPRDDVAKAVGYLGHFVSTYLGHSVSEHLDNLRIAEGRRLLEESDVTVCDMASSVGCADPAHFTRAFTRATGSSPAAYRLQLGLL